MLQSKKGKTGGAYTGYTTSRRVSAAATKEVDNRNNFIMGYRNREDTSFLDPRTLVPGSHDVLTNVSGRIGPRKGYTMDGPTSSVVAPIQGPFDWETQTGYVHHLRAGFLTDGSNGKLQIRYDDGETVSYLDLISDLSSTLFRYVPFWDSANVRSILLMVNGSEGIWEWGGGITTVGSATSNTVVTAGTKTFPQLGFTTTGSFIASGVTYTYSGTSGDTLTGVSPDPSGIVVDTPMYQAPVFTAVGSMTFDVTPDPPSGFTFDLISQLNNQAFFASNSSNLVYMSVAGDYKDYSQSTARLQYEGEQLTTQGTVKAFIQSDDQMYISAGLDEWYLTKFIETTITNQISGATLTYENASLQRLKTASGQASQSQEMTIKIKNQIVFVSNEPILNTLGFIENIQLFPQIEDISFPIVNDMNSYDFTDASAFYSKQFIYLAVPKMGLFRIFNMTNPQNPYWEAPQNIALSGFSQLEDNSILGHSYQTSESYLLFNGYSDRAPNLNETGLPISAVALFAFDEDGLRTKRKSFNVFFTEGYMTPGTNITVGLIYRSPNPGTSVGQSFMINGTAPYVLSPIDNSSLGKSALGKNPLAGNTQYPQQLNLPPYFAVNKTFTKYPYLAYSPMFSSYGLNQVWEILSFGNNVSPTTELPTDITL